MQRGQAMVDTSRLAQDARDGATRARQSLTRGGHVRLAGQIRPEGLGPWRAPQAFRRLITHLEDAVDHHLTDALRRVLAGARLAVQDGFILRGHCSQALAPFLHPPLRQAHGLGILLARPGGVLAQPPAEVGAGRLLYCFHARTLLGRRPLSSLEGIALFLLLSTMYGNTQGHDVSNSYTLSQNV
jgi:hypothetical protein